MSNSLILSNLLATSSPTDLVDQLKALKNSIIGNTWKKVEVVEDEALLR
jgi:hypothetical protein